MATRVSTAGAALHTPHAAAVAEIAFSLLAGASLVLIRLAVPGNIRDATGLMGRRRARHVVMPRSYPCRA